MQVADFCTTLRRARVQRTLLSPTRKNNPQPIGLVYQSPLYLAAPVGFYFLIRIIKQVLVAL